MGEDAAVVGEALRSGPVPTRGRELTTQEICEQILSEEMVTRDRKFEMLQRSGWQAFQAVSEFGMVVGLLSKDDERRVRQLEILNSMKQTLVDEFGIQVAEVMAESTLRSGI